MSKELRGEPMVTLRLSAETAADLYATLYMLGEHHAAGAPIHPLSTDSEMRFGRLMDSILGQMGRTLPYNRAAPPADEIL